MSKNTLKMLGPLVLDVVSAAIKQSYFPPSDQRQFLESCLPLPLPGLITISEFHAKNLSVLPGTRSVWFITQNDPQSVFYDESSGVFGACWGPDGERGTYDDLGFRSRDPIEMYSL